MKQRSRRTKSVKSLEYQLQPPPIKTNSNRSSSSSSSASSVGFKFRIGSQVEVTSDEDGFNGAWYSATVLQPPPSFKQLKDQLYVQYTNLLSHKNKSTLLKEFVDFHNVRPKPPLDKNNVPFRVNDIVDAFYKDGWWCGVVTQLVEQDKYRVSFSNPPEELLFHFNDLRPHKDWIRGNWILPQKQSIQELTFIRGTTVEVNIDTDNLCDVWFPATFIKQVSGNSFLVEYKESKEAEPQNVVVDSLRIRPSPPSSSVEAFNLLEQVDAFYDSRWLSGVVTEILGDGRYIVSFRHTEKEELSYTDLRLHMEWNNGKWTRSSQDTSMKSNSEKESDTVDNGGSKVKTQAPLEGSDGGESNVVSDRIFTKKIKRGLRELQQLGVEITNYYEQSVSSRPLRRKKKVANALFHERFKPKTKHINTLKEGEDNNHKSNSLEVKDDDEKLSVLRKRRRPPNLQGDALGVTAVRTPSKSDVVKPAFGPVLLMGLTHNNGKIIIDSRGGNLNLEHTKVVEDEENNINDDESVESGQTKEGEVSNQKRKRSLLVGGPKTNEAEPTEQEKRDDNIKECPRSEVDKTIAILEHPPGPSDSVPESRMMKLNDQMEQPSDIRLCSMRSPSRKQIRKSKIPNKYDLNEQIGKDDNPNKQLESQTEEDSVDNMEVQGIEVLSNGLHKAPHNDLEGAACSLATDFGVAAERTVGPSDWNAEIRNALVDQVKERGKSIETEIGSQTLDKNGPGLVPVEGGEELPFAKNSPIWEMIENMQVLKQIPQKPHFRPLYNCKEECREGLAIGSMVTFTTLVERICKWHFGDSKKVLEGYLEALVDLEELGFNVTPVRERLNKLIGIKSKYEEAQNRAKEIEREMMEGNVEKASIKGEIGELDRMIGELMEKRALVMSKKERNEEEMKLLHTSMDDVKSTLENAEKEFDKINSSPLC